MQHLPNPISMLILTGIIIVYTIGLCVFVLHMDNDAYFLAYSYQLTYPKQAAKRIQKMWKIWLSLFVFNFIGTEFAIHYVDYHLGELFRAFFFLPLLIALFYIGIWVIFILNQPTRKLWRKFLGTIGATLFSLLFLLLAMPTLEFALNSIFNKPNYQEAIVTRKYSSSGRGSSDYFYTNSDSYEVPEKRWYREVSKGDTIAFAISPQPYRYSKPIFRQTHTGLTYWGISIGIAGLINWVVLNIVVTIGWLALFTNLKNRYFE